MQIRYLLGVALTLATMALPASARAEDGASPSQGSNTPAAGPQQLTTADFFKYPNIGGARISPSGKYIALLIPGDQSDRLNIADLGSLHYTAAYEIRHPELIRDFAWVNDQQLVWETGNRYGPHEALFRHGDLMVGRADRSEGHKIGTSEGLVGSIAHSPDEILVGVENQVYRENINTQDLEPVAELPYDFARPLADHAGNVRAAIGTDKEDFVTSLWDDTKKQWRTLRRGKDDAAKIHPVAVAADGRHLYVRSDVETPTDGLYLLDPDSGESRLLFRDDKVNWDFMLYGLDGKEPAGVVYFPDYPAYRFFDENSPTAKVYNDLRHAFPGNTVLVTSHSDDGRLAVVSVESDKRSTEYYLFDLAQHRLQRLFSSRPWVDASQMSEMSAFAIKARDGVELHGYLTIPKGHVEKNLPLIVLPHGGPTLRDYWGFDPEVQFLAYHGYAVLQLNFRGSAGYGRDFEHAGYGHWGTAMQDDLSDATRWVIQEGIADAKRICIFGSSYGGYAAMMGVIREPDLYRCGIAASGPYDLTVQTSSSDTVNYEIGRAYLRSALGADEQDLKARSPVYNVDKIKVPIFLAHGREDKRVPFKNFEEMTAALDKAGKAYEVLVKDHEAHGFYLEANRVEFYDRLLAFLDKNIGSDAAEQAKPPGLAH